MNRESELAKIEAVVRSYYDAMSKSDYERMRQSCASDYEHRESLHVWGIDEHIAHLRVAERRTTVACDFKDIHLDVHLEVGRGHMDYRRIAESTIVDSNAPIFWLEDAAVRRENGEWKIAHLTSTGINRPKKQ